MTARAAVVAVAVLATVALSGSAFAPTVRATAVSPSQTPPQSDACLTRFLGGLRAHVDSPRFPLRVWWGPRHPDDAVRATELLTAGGGRIWPKLVALLGRAHQPLSDAAVACPHGRNGRLDVYLTRVPLGRIQLTPARPALTLPYGEDYVGYEPVFIVARPTISRSILAHELFHAFTHSYRRPASWLSYNEWDEAAATWAQNFVYPGDQVEHAHSGAFRFPSFPIHIPNAYRAWVFLLYLEKTQPPKERIVRDILEATTTASDGDSAVDAAIPGGFAERFPEFALYAWNQHPLAQTRLRRSFRDWDGLAAVPLKGNRPTPTVTLHLHGKRKHHESLGLTNLRVLAREYYRFRVGGAVGQVEFENTLATNPDAHVRAFLKFSRGGWRLEDWSRRARVRFCRREPNQDIEELILVIANSDAENRVRPAQSPALIADDSCWLPTTWNGDVRSSYSARQTGRAYELETSITTTGILALARDTTRASPIYAVVGGSVTATATRTETHAGTRCTWSGSASYDPSKPSGGGFILLLGTSSPAANFWADGNPGGDRTLVGMETCTHEDGRHTTTISSRPVDDVLFALSRKGPVSVSRDLTTIQGSDSGSRTTSLVDGSLTESWSDKWNFAGR